MSYDDRYGRKRWQETPRKTICCKCGQMMRNVDCPVCDESVCMPCLRTVGCACTQRAERTLRAAGDKP